MNYSSQAVKLAVTYTWLAGNVLLVCVKKSVNLHIQITVFYSNPSNYKCCSVERAGYLFIALCSTHCYVFTWKRQQLKLFDAPYFRPFKNQQFTAGLWHEVQQVEADGPAGRESDGRAAEEKPVGLANMQPSGSQKGRRAGSVRWPTATRADSWNVKLSHQRTWHVSPTYSSSEARPGAELN